MSTRILIRLLGAALLAVVGWTAQPGASLAEPYYQGPKKCQECHRDEYGVWEKTKHAKSFKTVHKSKDAKKILKALGEKSMKKSKVCTVCHYTMVSKKPGAKPRPKAGPSCESCHGASSDWLPIHNNYGGPNVKREDETPEHRAQRIEQAKAAGMIWSFMRYDLAKQCMACHGLARDGIDGDTLAKMLAAGHRLNTEFEFVRYSQGSVRHRFYPPNVTVNAEMDPPELARAFVQGQAAQLVSASAAIGRSDDAKYKAAQEARVASAKAALSKVTSVPEAAALIAEPSDANARALVDAIEDKDLTAEVGPLLPDPSTYK